MDFPIKILSYDDLITANSIWMTNMWMWMMFEFSFWRLTWKWVIYIQTFSHVYIEYKLNIKSIYDEDIKRVNKHSYETLINGRKSVNGIYSAWISWLVQNSFFIIFDKTAFAKTSKPAKIFWWRPTHIPKHAEYQTGKPMCRLKSTV